MALASLSAPASMTAEQYHRISEHLDALGSGPPPGRRFHGCFGHGDQLMVFDVWDSIEQLDAFTAMLMPILVIEHIDMAPPEPLEVHDLVDGGDSRALRMTIAELRDEAFFIRPVEKPLHSIKAKPADDHGSDETPTSARSRATRASARQSGGHRIARRPPARHPRLTRRRLVLKRRDTATAGVTRPGGGDLAAVGGVERNVQPPS